MNWGFIGVIVAIIFGITTIILTIYTIRLARRKKPVWAYATEKIIGLGTNAPSELKLTFGGIPVNDVYQTNFIFFNRGNEAIRKDDVTEAVTIVFKGSKVLRPPAIIKKSRDAINLQVVQRERADGDAIELDFLFLDHDDGGICEVLHTATEKTFSEGNVIGVKDIRNVGRFRYAPRSVAWLTPITLLTLLIMVLLIVITKTELFGLKLPTLAESFVYFLLGICLGALSNFVPQYLNYLRFPKWIQSNKS